MLNPGSGSGGCVVCGAGGGEYFQIFYKHTHTLMLTQRSRGVLEGEILANQRRWIVENMEKRSGREADSY